MIAFTLRKIKYMYMTQDSDKTPKKPSRGKRGRPKKKTETEEFIEEETESFNNKIRAALEANLQDYAKRKNLSQKQSQAITSFVEEHLSCFIILGYTVAGEPVTIVNANTQKDSDSLGTALQKFLAKYSDPPPPIGLF